MGPSVLDKKVQTDNQAVHRSWDRNVITVFVESSVSGRLGLPKIYCTLIPRGSYSEANEWCNTAP